MKTFGLSLLTHMDFGVCFCSSKKAWVSTFVRGFCSFSQDTIMMVWQQFGRAVLAGKYCDPGALLPIYIYTFLTLQQSGTGATPGI